MCVHPRLQHPTAYAVMHGNEVKAAELCCSSVRKKYVMGANCFSNWSFITFLHKAELEIIYTIRKNLCVGIIALFSHILL